MAELNQRRSAPVWILLFGALAALLLIWLIWGWLIAPFTTPPAATAPAATDSTVTLVPVAVIITAPASWFDRDVSLRARVADVPTDRGFYLEENGQRIFAILGKGFTENQVNINPGQTVRVSGVIRTSSKIDEAEMGVVKSESRAIIAKEPMYIVVRDVEILARP